MKCGQPTISNASFKSYNIGPKRSQFKKLPAWMKNLRVEVSMKCRTRKFIFLSIYESLHHRLLYKVGMEEEKLNNNNFSKAMFILSLIESKYPCKKLYNILRASYISDILEEESTNGMAQIFVKERRKHFNNEKKSSN